MVQTKGKLLTLLLGLALCQAAFAGRPDTVRIVFIGDVMSHGPQVSAALRHGGNPANPADYDYSSYFQYVQPWFREADLVVANMEFPVGVLPYSGYPFFSAPPALPEEARRSRIAVFLTANNHLCDRGKAGLDSTYARYSRMGVPFTGFYRSEGEEYETDPLILDIRGHRIALANFTYLDGHGETVNWKKHLMFCDGYGKAYVSNYYGALRSGFEYERGNPVELK